MRNLISLLLMVSFLSACAKKEQNHSSPANKTDDTSPPPRKPTTTPTTTIDDTKIFQTVDLACMKDDDCAYHRNYITKDGKCCASCTLGVGSKKWVKKIMSICNSKSHEGCPVKKCAPAPKLECIKNRCIGILKPPASALSNNEPYTCKADADCVKTAIQGALNKAWYEQNKSILLKGKNTCATKGTKSPRCIKNICTEIKSDGTVDPACTKKALTWWTK